MFFFTALLSLTTCAANVQCQRRRCPPVVAIRQSMYCCIRGSFGSSKYFKTRGWLRLHSGSDLR